MPIARKIVRAARAANAAARVIDTIGNLPIYGTTPGTDEWVVPSGWTLTQDCGLTTGFDAQASLYGNIIPNWGLCSYNQYWNWQPIGTVVGPYQRTLALGHGQGTGITKTMDFNRVYVRDFWDPNPAEVPHPVKTAPRYDYWPAIPNFSDPLPYWAIPYQGTGQLPDGDIRLYDWAKDPTPEQQQLPDKVIGPGGVTTRTGTHTMSPPGKGQKEGKTIANLPPGVVSALINIITESRDAVNAVYDALPKKMRADAWRKYAPKGQPGVIPEVPIERKLQILYNNWRSLDPGAVVTNLIKNQVEDALIGRMSNATTKYLRDSGWDRPVGPGTGPAF